MTDPLIAAARFLTAQLPWLRHATDAQGQPVAADVFREIGDCAARMRSLVDGPRDAGRFSGRCTALVDDPTALCPVNCDCHNGPHYACDEPGGCGSAGCGKRECGHDVIARHGSDIATCKACGAHYDVEERQASMRIAIEDWLAKPVEIAGVLLRLGLPIGYSTIAAYAAKGLLVSHGSDAEGKPLYRVGDVIDLRASAQARRLARG